MSLESFMLKDEVKEVEYDDLMQEIQEINGYSLDDAVEEAKN